MLKKNSCFLKFIFISVMFSISCSIQAYRWIMTNWTNEALLVKVELLASDHPFFYLIGPKRSADFDWPLGNPRSGHCLNNIIYIEPDAALLNNSSIIRHYTVSDNKGLNDFINKQPRRYPQHTAKLRFLPDDLYNQSIEQAKRIAGGKIVGWFADIIAHSKCRSRDIDIVRDEKGNIQFYTLAN